MVANQSHKRRLSGGSSETSDRQLPSLTPLRGIAALWVVLYHYCGTAQFFPNLDITPHSYLISKGYLAVDMFFVLSGFVMAHVYRRAFSEGVGEHYRGFLVARIARLYPLHVFILSLFVVTATASQFLTGLATGWFESIPLTGPRSWGAIIANIFMLQGLAAGQLSWNYPAWSISVEFIAYLAFPLALPAIARAPKAVRLVIAALLFAVLAWLVALTKGDLDQWDGPITLMRCMPEFLLGTLLYFAFCDYGERFWLSSDLAVLAILPATLPRLTFRRARSADRFAVRRARPFGREQYRRFRQARQYRTADLARRNLLFVIFGTWSHSVRLQQGFKGFRRPAHRCPVRWPIPRSHDAHARAVHLLLKRYVLQVSRSSGDDVLDSPK